MRMRKLWISVVLCAALTAAAAVYAAYGQAQEQPAPAAKATLENLMTAYNGESNANARYMAFAVKADEEGYGKVASLFRAAARAEQVHLEHHAAVIKELGGTPAAKIEAAVVGTTKENLEEALKGESYEAEVMYAGFLATAEKENVKGAVDAFEDAKAAEAVHAGWFKKVLGNLDAWKAPKTVLYVCPTCGNIMDVIPGPTCPICDEPAKNFIAME